MVGGLSLHPSKKKLQTCGCIFFRRSLWPKFPCAMENPHWFPHRSVCVVYVWVKIVFMHGDGSLMVWMACYGLQLCHWSQWVPLFSLHRCITAGQHCFYRIRCSQWYKHHYFFQMFPIFSHENDFQMSSDHHWYFSIIPYLIVHSPHCSLDIHMIYVFPLSWKTLILLIIRHNNVTEWKSEKKERKLSHYLKAKSVTTPAVCSRYFCFNTCVRQTFR